MYIDAKELRENKVKYRCLFEFMILILTTHTLTTHKISRVYDPGYTVTAVTKSKISFIDGNAGVLEYRGYPIEVLASKSNFLEVAFLLIYGHLPNKDEYKNWRDGVMKHTFVHTRLSTLMSSFNYDAHPMGMFIRYSFFISSFYYIA